MSESEKYEHIPVETKNRTKERIDDVGRKGETYDEIVNRLLDTYQKFHEIRDMVEDSEDIQDLIRKLEEGDG